MVRIAAAAPFPFAFPPAHTAVMMIDMQRDFLEPGGFGESLGNDVSQLRRTIEPLRGLLTACRGVGMPVIVTFDSPVAKDRRRVVEENLHVTVKTEEASATPAAKTDAAPDQEPKDAARSESSKSGGGA